MDIYLIRHADALPQGVNGVKNDEDRPLSDVGWAQAAQLGKAIKKHGIVFDLVVGSPLVRAQQTAVELRTVLDLQEAQMETREELAPGGRPKKLARYLNGLQATTVALVGHQPDVNMFAGWLMGEKDVQIQFAKAGAALIRVEGPISKGSGALVWLITPEWME